ncbi:uncharacterized protein [Penaeus vannamei]|uniref:uncharacterized protein n=1 Tax=Penaeus vannamei TaxID=6689 RepID=UPI00387FB074
MSFNIFLVLWTLLVKTEGLEPDLPVKACQDEFSSVSLTSTRLQVSTVVSTVTLLDVIPTYVSVTITDCEPYAITHTETVSQYQAPQLAYSTRYVTELKIKEKNRVYTYTSYQAETISITYSATDIEEHLTQVVGTTTATTLSMASVVETVTASITTTATYTQVDVSSSITYIPVYVTTTMTNAWPILKTVYQTEYIKEAVAYVTTVMETSTLWFDSRGTNSYKNSSQVVDEYSSSLKKLAITISMSFNIFLVLWTLLVKTEGLEPDLPVKACQDEFSSVSLTSTRLQVSNVVSTVTLLDVIPTYVSVTITDCEPYAITHTETVSQYQAPQLAYSTRYVTELKIKEKNRVYTYTSYQAETISITYSATDIEEHLTQVVGTTTATTLSMASVVETVTASITTTATYTQVDVSSSITYIPVYVTTTMTNAWPILKTVYQTEYIKEAVAYVTTVMETSTVYHCHGAYRS